MVIELGLHLMSVLNLVASAYAFKVVMDVVVNIVMLIKQK